MARDGNTARRVIRQLAELRAQGVLATELRVEPQPLTSTFFVEDEGGLSAEDSAAVVAGLGREHLDESGFLLSDPRQFPDWRDPVRAVLPNVPLEADASTISERMNVAFARHEFTREHVDTWLDFCLDPTEFCNRGTFLCASPLDDL
jgi:hypothetical protein